MEDIERLLKELRSIELDESETAADRFKRESRRKLNMRWRPKRGGVNRKRKHG